jgi:hypothetical protein
LDFDWVGGAGNVSRLVATSSFGAGIFAQVAGNIYATSNDIQLTGSLSASLASGYAWVGGANNVTRLVPTSSFGQSITARNYSGNSFGATSVANFTTIAFSGSAVDVSDMGSGVARITINASTAGGGGTSGTSGANGTSGTSGAGTSGTSGFGGTSGINGTDGSSGTNGTAGSDGSGGSSGTSGISGAGSTGGSNGTGGSSGTSGTSGTSGAIGTSGIDGSSGTSGISGTGVPGSSGSSGTSGVSGTNGTNGALNMAGTTDNGVLTYANNSTASVEDNLRFDATQKILTVSGSLDLYSGIYLRPNQYPPTAQAGMLYASGSNGQSWLMFHNGSTWITVNTTY